MKTYNPDLTQDCGNDFRPFVEDVFNMRSDHVTWLEKKLGKDGRKMLPRYDSLMEHKMNRFVDGIANLEKRKLMPNGMHYGHQFPFLKVSNAIN